LQPTVLYNNSGDLKTARLSVKFIISKNTQNYCFSSKFAIIVMRCWVKYFFEIEWTTSNCNALLFVYPFSIAIDL